MAYRPRYAYGRTIWVSHPADFMLWAISKGFIHLDGKTAMPHFYRAKCLLCIVRRIRYYNMYYSAAEWMIIHFQKYHADYLTIYTLAE